MTRLVVEDSALAQWQSLVSDAGRMTDCTLDADLESYLVFTLSRFVAEPAALSRVVAMEFLRAIDRQGRERRDSLRDVGDQCLLICGLFPEQASRRMVQLGYFVDLGRSAYRELAAMMQHGYADLYDNLSRGFLHLLEVLFAMRCMRDDPGLQPVVAMHIWEHTGSRVALQVLRRASRTGRC